MGGTAMFGILAVCGDIGGAFGPWLAGVVSDNAQKTAAVAGLAAQTGLELEQLGLKAGLLLGLVFPAVFNGVIVGAELTALFLESFWVNCFWVAAGELAVCYVLGYPLGLGLQRSSIFRRLLHTEEKQ